MDHFLVDYENIGEAGLKGVENLGPDTSTVIFYSEHADKISFDMHQTLCRCRSKLEFRKAQTGKKNALDFQLSTYLGYLVASHPGDRFYIISKDNGYHVVMDFWDNSNIQQLDYIGRAYERPAKQQLPAQVPEAQPAPKAAEVTKPDISRQETSRQQQQPRQDAQQPSARQEKPVSEAPRQQPRQDASGKPTGQEAAVQEPKDQQQPRQDAQQQNKQGTAGQGRRRSSGRREAPADESKPSDELMNSLSQLIENPEERANIGRFIVKYKTKQGVNNAIVKLYGTEKAGELYRKIKPLLKDKKGK